MEKMLITQNLGSVLYDIGSVLYDFTKLDLPSGQSLAVGIEAGCSKASERDLFSLNHLKKMVKEKLFEKISINRDTTLTAVGTAMNQTEKLLMLAMPNKDYFELSNDDFKAIENHLRARLLIM
jgi:hypothetical protein